MALIGAFFVFLRFQRHVHTYRILPDADGLLAVQVSFYLFTDPRALPDKDNPRKETFNVLAQTVHRERNTASQMELEGSNNGLLLPVSGRTGMFVFPLCTGSVANAVALLFERHLCQCHVVACLQH